MGLFLISVYDNGLQPPTLYAIVISVERAFRE